MNVGKVFEGIKGYVTAEDKGKYVSEYSKNIIGKFIEDGAEALGAKLDKWLQNMIDGLKNGPAIETGSTSGSKDFAGGARSYVKDSFGYTNNDFVSKVERYLSGEDVVPHRRVSQKELQGASGKYDRNLLEWTDRDSLGNGRILTYERLPGAVKDYVYAHGLSELDTPGLGDESLERHVGVDTKAINALKYLADHSDNPVVRKRARRAYVSGLTVAKLGNDMLSRAVSKIYGLKDLIGIPDIGGMEPEPALV